MSYIITIRHDEMTKISKFYIVSDTSVTRPTIECDVTALNRPINIRFFLGPGLSLEPEAEEFASIQDLHERKHRLRYDSDIARKHRLLNRYTFKRLMFVIKMLYIHKIVTKYDTTFKGRYDTF